MRPPKPPSLRIADGTRKRAGRSEISEDPGDERFIDRVPKCQKGASEEFQKWWKYYCTEMVAVGTLTQRDLAPIGELCEAHERKANAQRVLREAGSEYTETETGIRRHPALITIETAERLIRSRQNDLGFSPIGRLRVPARNKGEGKKTVAALNRKREA